MARFKIGDVVKVIATQSELDSIFTPIELKGMVGTVVHINFDNFYRIDFMGDHWNLRECDLDKVLT